MVYILIKDAYYCSKTEETLPKYVLGRYTYAPNQKKEAFL